MKAVWAGENWRERRRRKALTVALALGGAGALTWSVLARGVSARMVLELFGWACLVGAVRVWKGRR